VGRATCVEFACARRKHGVQLWDWATGGGRQSGDAGRRQNISGVAVVAGRSRACGAAEEGRDKDGCGSGSATGAKRSRARCAFQGQHGPAVHRRRVRLRRIHCCRRANEAPFRQWEPGRPARTKGILQAPVSAPDRRDGVRGVKRIRGRRVATAGDSDNQTARRVPERLTGPRKDRGNLSVASSAEASCSPAAVFRQERCATLTEREDASHGRGYPPRSRVGVRSCFAATARALLSGRRSTARFPAAGPSRRRSDFGRRTMSPTGATQRPTRPHPPPARRGMGPAPCTVAKNSTRK